jgi:hypothetical protein
MVPRVEMKRSLIKAALFAWKALRPAKERATTKEETDGNPQLTIRRK